MVSDYIVDIFLSSLDGCLYRCQVKNNNFIFFIIATTNIQAQIKIAKIGKKIGQNWQNWQKFPNPNPNHRSKYYYSLNVVEKWVGVSTF
jgi:hypothetical protein